MMLILALALLAAPSGLHAQPTPCVCNHYTVNVDPAVNCKVTFCYWTTPLDSPVCITIPPGGIAQIPCPVSQVTILLCDNTSFVLIGAGPVISVCTAVLQVAPNCCVRVCRGTDPAGCQAFTVSPAPCPVVNCP
jgi:hypothetical protein